MPLQLDRVWRHMILFNHQKYKEFWDVLVEGYIHRIIPDQFQPKLEYMKNLFEKSESLTYNYDEFDEYDFENFQESEVLMTKEEIENTKNHIKNNLELLTNEEIITKLENKLKSEIWFKIQQDLETEIITSDEESFHLLQELIDVDFPSSIMKLIESKLRIDSDSWLILIIEYFKFLVLKSKYPSEWISPVFVDKVWVEHWVLTKHFHDVWEGVLNIDEEILHYSPASTDAEIFKDKYEQTIVLYIKIFGSEPHPQIWRDWKVEYNDFQKSNYNVNLEKLVNYCRFEYNFLSKVATIPDMPNKTEQFDEIVNDFSSLTSNIIHKYSSDKMSAMIHNRKIRHIAQKCGSSSHLWRKYCIPDKKIIMKVSLESDQNLYWVGGYKFSWNQDYLLDLYWVNFNNEHLLMNLDDFADNCCESIHLYSEKDNELDLHLNRYLSEGQNEAELSWKNRNKKIA